MTTTMTPVPVQERVRSPLRRAMWPLVGAGTALLATGYVARVDPNLSGGYPPCPLKMMTGLDCPGCGGLRCVHALTQGDIGTALDQNLLVVILLPIVALWLAVTIIRRLRGNTRPTSMALNPRLVNGFWYGIVGVALVFTIVRNLPFVDFLQSGVG